MSIADKITRLQDAKESIADAITAQGGTVSEGDGFEEFANDIGTISSGITVNESYDISEGTLNGATVELEGDVVAHIPDGVTTIGMGAFMDNTVIDKVIMPDSIETIEDGNSYGVSAFHQCSRLKNVEFSNHLTSIGDFAFYGCTSLTSITIPDSVTSIGDNAFYDTSLTDIYYTGTQAEWEAITGISGAGIPEGATIHYEYTPE